MPWGQVPVLYIDDKPLSQTVAICRLLATQYDLTPEGHFLQARADELTEATSDVTNLAAAVRRAAPSQKPTIKKNFLENQLPNFLKRLENQLSEGENFCCGNKVSQLIRIL